MILYILFVFHQRERYAAIEFCGRKIDSVSTGRSPADGGALRKYYEWYLADDYGLGKTVQAIALLSYFQEHERKSEPFGITVPMSRALSMNLYGAPTRVSAGILLLLNFGISSHGRMVRAECGKEASTTIWSFPGNVELV